MVNDVDGVNNCLFVCLFVCLFIYFILSEPPLCEKAMHLIILVITCTVLQI